MVNIKDFGYFLILILISISLNVFGQYSNRYKEGYIIDKYGAKYSGLIKITEGVNEDPDYLIFKESEKADKVRLDKEKLRSFVIEKDSFVVVNKYKIPKKKTILDGFAKALLKTPNASLCELIQRKRVVSPSSDAYDYDKDYYFIVRDRIFTLLNSYNFKSEMSAVVEDDVALMKRIDSGELKLSDLGQIIELYHSK